jgi:hypothetical protein
MEKSRKKHEPLNKQTYQQCRELSAWLSVYRFSSGEYKRQAAAIINAYVGRR